MLRFFGNFSRVEVRHTLLEILSKRWVQIGLSVDSRCRFDHAHAAAEHAADGRVLALLSHRSLHLLDDCEWILIRLVEEVIMVVERRGNHERKRRRRSHHHSKGNHAVLHNSSTRAISALSRVLL